ncbi:hypothetical protein L1887_29314 [Cichorium endivia]|nr:hypothetical protein L1887_29314 [Cichorium endivia]
MIDVPRPRIHRSPKGNRSVLQNSATPRKLNHWYARKLGIFITVTLISERCLIRWQKVTILSLAVGMTHRCRISKLIPFFMLNRQQTHM